MTPPMTFAYNCFDLKQRTQWVQWHCVVYLLTAKLTLIFCQLKLARVSLGLGFQGCTKLTIRNQQLTLELR